MVGLQGTMPLPLSHPTWHLGHCHLGTRCLPGHLSLRRQGRQNFAIRTNAIAMFTFLI